MREYRVSDSPKSYRKSVAEKTLQSLWKMLFSKWKKKKKSVLKLKHSFRVAFGLCLPWLKGVFSFLFAACRWEKNELSTAGRSQALSDPGIGGQAEPTLIRSRKQYLGFLQPLEMMHQTPLAYDCRKTRSFYLGSSLSITFASSVCSW